MKRKIFKSLKIISAIIVILLFVIVVSFVINPNVIRKIAENFQEHSVNIRTPYMNNIVVEIPETYELMQIAFGLTVSYQKDKNLLNKNSTYYEYVADHFQQFRNHKLILKIEQYLKKSGAYGGNTLGNRSMSIDFDINNNIELVSNHTFNYNSFLFKLYKADYFVMTEYEDLINDFAKRSDFKDFYKSHLKYYEKLILNSYQICDFKQMKSWLEEKFSTKIQSYRIIISPLTGGYHNTIHVYDKLKNAQIFVFVCAPDENLNKLTTNELALASVSYARQVFTEIDHNYTGHVTSKFYKELIEAMPDFKVWNHHPGKNYYPSAQATFDEYMTWSVFCLYALDVYPKEIADKIIQQTEDQMIDRKFTWFQPFNRELTKLYLQNSRPPIAELYPYILNWMKNRY